MPLQREVAPGSSPRSATRALSGSRGLGRLARSEVTESAVEEIRQVCGGGLVEVDLNDGLESERSVSVKRRSRPVPIILPPVHHRRTCEAVHDHIFPIAAHRWTARSRPAEE